MSDLILADIVTQCLVLEKQAVQIYLKLRDQAKAENLKSFWLEMSQQEIQHVQYWENLLKIVTEKKIPNLFDQPDEILQELKTIEKKLNVMLTDKEDHSDISKSFLIAYHIEFFLLHPAFEAMFFLMRKEMGDSSPEKDYRTHIHRLIEMMKTIKNDRPEFELISHLTDHLWTRNQQLARQMADIKQLRGLLPICMHCKKIRDDKGFWQQVEEYIGDHSEAVFSHGICNDCIEKYYPEIYQDLKISKSKND